MDICGYCGSTEGNPNNALCAKCDGDYWIQSQDFDNPELKDYVQTAANNLNVTVETLKEIVNED